jgi:phosphatidylglycerol:prolipoprotein diacylglycerol transferase
MIPYFSWQTITLGPLTLQVWGIFVSLGFLTALFLGLYFVKKRNLDKEILTDLFVWLLLGGIFGARIFHIIFYEPDFYIYHPAEIIKFWHGGASSLGGLVGAFAALLIYARIKKINARDFLPYGDIIGLVFWLGWGIGRIGCFFIHDHPGRLSDFWLTVNFPSGARFDLGLLESILSFIIFAVVFVFYKKYFSRPGIALFAGFWIYFPVRFFMDFLRAVDLPVSDARYLYLTPAQWGMGLVFLVLTFLFFCGNIRQQKMS